jgi:hypothetical protein
MIYTIVASIFVSTCIVASDSLKELSTIIAKQGGAITTSEVSYICLDNDDTCKTIHSCLTRMQQSSINPTINTCSIPVDKCTEDAVIPLMQSACIKSYIFKWKDNHGCKLSPEFYRAALASPHVDTVQIVGFSCDMKSLCDLIVQYKTLKRVLLSSVPCTTYDTFLQPIVNEANNSPLEHIAIRWCLKDESCTGIIEILKHKNNLRSIDLSHNSLLLF